MAIRIAPDFTGTSGNGHTPDPTEIDRRQLQIEANYITHDGLKYIQPPQPLIHGWLYKDSPAWLSGKPGCGKSLIALDIAYSVGTGTPWQGHPVHHGTVLYIAAEGATGLSIRANAWMAANGKNLDPQVIYLPLAINLTAPEQTDTQALTQALVALQPDLVIIDTQARVTTGLEENSSKDMGRFIDALETLRAANPATYLIVHHTPRNGENLRGSTALEGAADTVLHASKDGNLVTLTCKKQKNAAEAPDLQLYMQPIGESVIMSHEAVELIKEMTPAMEQLLKLLVELFGTDEAGSTELRNASEMTPGSFTRTIKHLVKDAYVNERKQGNRIWYHATTKGQFHSSKQFQTVPEQKG